jgi:alkanesulfonate monooxygenase SsuD/methylene tetrahydromethanopterin reductase-like flavin-dependent oxidoreductase (luciferase family)
MTREQYEAGATLRGAYFVGTPEQVVEKILFQHEIFQHDRFALQFSIGPVPHVKVMRCIELLGTQVMPAVNAELERRAPVTG